MEKNIAVIDADGNVYGATWPKRARGLVKSGRARFVNRNTICLVRPPAYVEGKCMEHTVDLEIKNTQQPETVENLIQLISFTKLMKFWKEMPSFGPPSLRWKI